LILHFTMTSNHILETLQNYLKKKSIYILLQSRSRSLKRMKEHVAQEPIVMLMTLGAVVFPSVQMDQCIHKLVHHSLECGKQPFTLEAYTSLHLPNHNIFLLDNRNNSHLFYQCCCETCNYKCSS
jgi:hypothetical protein